MWEERVKLGVALLDSQIPYWYKHISKDNMQINNCKSCILGQLFGGFFTGCDKIGITPKQGEDYGLDCSGYDKDILKDLWSKEIDARFDKEKADGTKIS